MQNKLIVICFIYRPPYSSDHPHTPSQFLNEFGAYIETIIIKPETLIIAGDFNILMDNLLDQNTIRFNSIISSFSSFNHINFPTHFSNHILDLVITRSL